MQLHEKLGYKSDATMIAAVRSWSKTRAGQRFNYLDNYDCAFSQFLTQRRGYTMGFEYGNSVGGVDVILDHATYDMPDKLWKALEQARGSFDNLYKELAA